MEGTITETQNTQKSSATSILRSSPRSIPRTSISPLSALSLSSTHGTSPSTTKAPDIVQNSGRNPASKNKRKNFNPRCSSLNDEETSNVNQDDKANEVSPSDAHTFLLNQEKLISDSTMKATSYTGHNSNRHKKGSENSDEEYAESDSMNSSNYVSESNSVTTTTMLKRWQNLLDLQKYHKRQQPPKELLTYSPTALQSSLKLQQVLGSEEYRRDRNIQLEKSKSQFHNNASPTTSSSIDRQLKSDFACNAFNAVQELLNVYGLSISPGDIVDAFKKQQQQRHQANKHGECPQPPTPPRTPVSALQSGSGTSINSEEKIEDKSFFQQLQHSSAAEGTDPSESVLSLAAVSKLIASPTVSSTTVTLAGSSLYQRTDASSSQPATINKSGSSTENTEYYLQSTCDDHAEDDDENSRVAESDVYDAGDANKAYPQQQQRTTNFSDSVNESTSMNFYDMNHCYNDNDSNISSTIDDDRASSDDNALCGENVATVDNQRSSERSPGGDEENDCGEGEYRLKRTNSTDGEVGRLSVKNVDCLLDKYSLLGQIQNDDKQFNADGIKYLTKFSSYDQCKSNTCQLENLREHYHCYDIPCLGKTFNKKEEVIRHVKWHKKRAESLNHGFLRFSSSDDCSLAFGSNCTHNRKQTHYHCFQPNCDKVYISTSDVQMHSNYHRKDSAIYQEGFQRYRATEECNADYCMFSGQRTTHFHCRRDNCRYTFKNKADMEKHKSYHIKDLQLSRDGFKKFLKTESCPYERCRFSRICNHIHCVRENCHYVLHSSGQLLSHKRKHERMDSEQAYRRFKIAQKATASVTPNITISSSSPSGNGSLNTSYLGLGPICVGSESKSSTPSTTPSLAISPDLHIPSDVSVSFAAGKQLQHDLNASSSGTATPSHSLIVTPPLDMSLFYGNPCHPLEIIQKLHHKQTLSTSNNCEEPNFPTTPGIKPSAISNSASLIAPAPLLAQAVLTKSAMDEIEELIRQYFTSNCSRQKLPQPLQTDQIEPLNLKSSSLSSGGEQPLCITAGTSSGEHMECLSSMMDPHLHCLVKNCGMAVPRNLVEISEHMQMHELSRNAEGIIHNSNLLQITSIDGFFNRKRGRPPKNRVVEVYNNARNQSPQAIFTSFKLEKTLNDPQMLSPVITATTPQQRPANLSSSTVTSQVANQISPYADNTVANATNPKSLVSHLTEGRIQAFHSSAQKCSDHEANICQFFQQFHFHCRFSTKCNFASNDNLAMEQHITDVHLNENPEGTNEKINRSKHIKHGQLEQYDATSDCPFENCPHRQKCKHFHCNTCKFAMVTPMEIEEHLAQSRCSGEGIKTDGRTTPESGKHASVNNNNEGDGKGKNLPKSITPGSMDETHIKYLQAFAEQEQKREDTSSSSHNLSEQSLNENLIVEMNNSSSPSKIDSNKNEDEKVSVVRAAGTFFPQNSNSSNDAEVSHPAHNSDYASDHDAALLSICQRPFCKLKKKPHRHCNLCNQAFSDSVKLEIHRLKHSTLALSGRGDSVDKDTAVSKDGDNIEEHFIPQDLSKPQAPSPSSSPLLGFSNSSAGMPATSPSGFQQFLPQGFAENFSMQNLHLAHLAMYQQSPFYYQNFYPFLRSQNLSAAFAAHPELLQMQLAVAAAASGAHHTGKDGPADGIVPVTSEGPNPPTLYPFVSATSTNANIVSGNATGVLPNIAASMGVSGQNFDLPKVSHELLATIGKRKRKAEDFEGPSQGLLDDLASASALVAAGTSKKIFKSSKQNNFKIFKDEPIPHGYLKFRFNEDCNFPNCGYRNHQSHFHCCRKDCYYSFCDKTRFVQHTARHERLDKLMGDDFKQYRANMRCGYEDCVYNKNLAGQNNKSSHFHCLKCNFICSDTNKVVAHRRQHSKMEFIRMAGFRKVANNEKCNASYTGPSTLSHAESTHDKDQNSESSGTSSNQGPTTGGSECTYSLKQTHYHCLVCDCSVLSRAQLGSHRHRI